jgi:hypothetical protein
MVLAHSNHLDVFLMAERQSTALGNPDLSVGHYVGGLGVRLVDCRDFTVESFIAEVSAGILTVLPVSLLFLQYLLRRDRAPGPFTPVFT